MQITEFGLSDSADSTAVFAIRFADESHFAVQIRVVKFAAHHTVMRASYKSYIVEFRLLETGGALTRRLQF